MWAMYTKTGRQVEAEATKIAELISAPAEYKAPKESYEESTSFS